MTPAYIHIEIGGTGFAKLRTAISNHLLHSIRFSKMKGRRRMISYFIRSQITARECAEIASALYAIENSCGPTAKIKAINIVSFPDIDLHLKG